MLTHRTGMYVVVRHDSFHQNVFGSLKEAIANTAAGDSIHWVMTGPENLISYRKRGRGGWVQVMKRADLLKGRP